MTIQILFSLSLHYLTAFLVQVQRNITYIWSKHGLRLLAGRIQSSQGTSNKI